MMRAPHNHGPQEQSCAVYMGRAGKTVQHYPLFGVNVLAANALTRRALHAWRLGHLPVIDDPRELVALCKGPAGWGASAALLGTAALSAGGAALLLGRG